MAVSVLSCNSSRLVPNIEQSRNLRLSFNRCNGAGFLALSIQVPKGYNLKKVVDEHGFCEYQLRYESQGVLYVSSNIYSGSSLNYENRLRAGIGTYSERRTANDQISVNGTQGDGKYWMEKIVGKYTIGYLNVSDTTFFDGSLQRVELID